MSTRPDQESKIYLSVLAEYEAGWLYDTFVRLADIRSDVSLVSDCFSHLTLGNTSRLLQKPLFHVSVPLVATAPNPDLLRFSLNDKQRIASAILMDDIIKAKSRVHVDVGTVMCFESDCSMQFRISVGSFTSPMEHALTVMENSVSKFAASFLSRESPLDDLLDGAVKVNLTGTPHLTYEPLSQNPSVEAWGHVKLPQCDIHEMRSKFHSFVMNLYSPEPSWTSTVILADECLEVANGTFILKFSFHLSALDSLTAAMNIRETFATEMSEALGISNSIELTDFEVQGDDVIKSGGFIDGMLICFNVFGVQDVGARSARLLEQEAEHTFLLPSQVRC